MRARRSRTDPLAPLGGVRRIPLLLLLAVPTFLAACDGGGAADPDPDPGPAPVASVTLDLDRLDMLPEGSARLQATTLDASGAVLSGRTVAWSTANPSVATVASDGTVTAEGLGSTVVTATSEGRAAEAEVVVTEAVLKETTVAVDDGYTLLSDSTEVASGTIRLQGSGESIEVGDVLMGTTNEGGGYLKKVVSVTSAGGTVTAQTENTTFDQAIDSANIVVTMDETVQELLAQRYAEGTVARWDLPRGMSIAPDGRVDLNGLFIPFTFSESDEIADGVTVEASVSGSFNILTGSDFVPGTSSIVFEYAGDPLPKKLRVQTTVGVELDVDVSASIIGDLAEAKGWGVSEEIFRKKIFPTTGCHVQGPLCYAVWIVVDAYMDVTAEAKASVTQPAYFKAGLSGAGVIWRRESGFTTLGGPLFEMDFPPPFVSIEGKTGLEFGLAPRLEFEVYEGLASAAAGVKGGVYGEVGASLWEWTAEAGFALSFLANADLSFWGLADVSGEWDPELTRLAFATYSGPLVRLEVTPDPLEVVAEETAQASVTAYSLITGGAVPFTPPVDWEIEDGSLASVNSSGEVTGILAGETTYRARIRDTETTIVSPDAGLEVIARNALRVDGCILAPSQSGCTANLNFSPGGSFNVLFGADDQTSTARCGTLIYLEDPFQGTFAYVIPIDAPTCLGVHTVNIPGNAAPGTYQIVIGPAHLEGYDDGAPKVLEFTVN